MIRIEEKNGEYVAIWDRLALHAFGDTPEEARLHLAVELRAEHVLLKGHHDRNRLGRHLSAAYAKGARAARLLDAVRR